MEASTKREKVVERVTPLELFFDLVFVFAVTQVTGLLAQEPTWTGLGQGMLALAAVWWAWAGFAWLTNTVNPEDGIIRIAMFASMAALLVAAIALPHAFGDDAVTFGIAYLAVRALHLWLYMLSTRDKPEVHAALMRLAPGFLIAPALILVAAAFDGPAQAAVWIAALLIDFLAPLIGGVRGWQVSPGHFVERHSLIIIIALGESIVAVGAAASGEPLGRGVVTGAVLGMAIAAALWWTYFDVVAIAAERRMMRASPEELPALVRDAYTYLHLPMIAGVVLIALGAKKSIAHVGDALHAMPAVCLCGGAALYLLAHIAFRLRNMGSVNRQRLVAAALCLAVIPLAMALPALAAMAVVTAILVGLVAYEAIRFREARARLRYGEEPAGG